MHNPMGRMLNHVIDFPCSATESSMEALKQPTIRTVAIIAEGVPERDTKHLIAYARAHNKVMIGPATVGGVQAGAFKIGDTAGTLDNIIACKLNRPGSIGFVSKSGGMSNEMYNVLARATDGLFEGESWGSDHHRHSTAQREVYKCGSTMICSDPDTLDPPLRHCDWRRLLPWVHLIRPLPALPEHSTGKHT